MAAAAESGPPATDYEAAQLQLRLGTVYWCARGCSLVEALPGVVASCLLRSSAWNQLCDERVQLAVSALQRVHIAGQSNTVICNIPACMTEGHMVCRELGGEWRVQRRYAHAQWLAAAAAPSPSQPPAFARLGDFYRDVAHDAARARRCYQRALALDPLQAGAGVCGGLA